MLIGFGSDMIEVKPSKTGRCYYGRRWRPYESEAVGPFDTFQEAIDGTKAEFPKDLDVTERA